MRGSAYLRNFGSKGKIQDTNGICDTLQAAMGTGGGNVPIIEEGVYMSFVSKHYDNFYEKKWLYTRCVQPI